MAADTRDSIISLAKPAIESPTARSASCPVSKTVTTARVCEEGERKLAFDVPHSFYDELAD